METQMSGRRLRAVLGFRASEIRLFHVCIVSWKDFKATKLRRTLLDSGTNANEGLTGEEHRGRCAEARRRPSAGLLTWLQLPCSVRYLTSKSKIFSTSTFIQVTFTAILPAKRLKDTLSGGPHRTEKPNRTHAKKTRFFFFSFFFN